VQTSISKKQPQPPSTLSYLFPFSLSWSKNNRGVVQDEPIKLEVPKPTVDSRHDNYFLMECQKHKQRSQGSLPTNGKATSSLTTGSSSKLTSQGSNKLPSKVLVEERIIIEKPIKVQPASSSSAGSSVLPSLKNKGNNPSSTTTSSILSRKHARRLRDEEETDSSEDSHDSVSAAAAGGGLLSYMTSYANTRSASTVAAAATSSSTKISSSSSSVLETIKERDRDRERERPSRVSAANSTTEPTTVTTAAANTSVAATSTTTIATATTTKTKLCCDKCDGKHETDDCPHYKKKRDDHPDAQKKNGKQIGGTSLLPGSYLQNARVIRQPGDGSCLFHSLSYGLGGGYTANRLRSEICAFIQANPQCLISETPLKDWVKWDSGGSSVSDYCRKMSRGSWGGGIEMACLSQMKQVNVHVYERSGGGYKRISAFDCASHPENKPIVRVLYCGGVHYDAIAA
jgi:hypothetical protein